MITLLGESRGRNKMSKNKKVETLENENGIQEGKLSEILKSEPTDTSIPEDKTKGDTDGDSEEFTPPHVIEEEKEKPKETKPKLPTVGFVHECNFLRVREGASLKSKELAILEAGSKVKINHGQSTESFYSVTTKDEIVGFCLKTYIKLV